MSDLRLYECSKCGRLEPDDVPPNRWGLIRYHHFVSGYDETEEMCESNAHDQPWVDVTDTMRHALSAYMIAGDDDLSDLDLLRRFRGPGNG